MTHRPGRPRSSVMTLALFSLSLASSAFAQAPPAADARHVQLDAHWRGEPYHWDVADGTVLVQSLTDDAARATVIPRAGQEHYALEMLWGRFPVKVGAECWRRPAAQFESCAEIGPREDTRAQKEQNAEDERKELERKRRLAARTAWMSPTVSSERVVSIVSEAMRDQQTWMRTPAARLIADNFACDVSNAGLPKITTEAQEKYAQARRIGPYDAQGEPILIEAAQLGNWRAVTTLFNVAMYGEHWESAQPLVAWLLQRESPAGYNKLAELHGTIASYEDGHASSADQDLVTALRWRAAQAGDPGAQRDMSDYFKERDPQLSERLMQCALERFPDLK
ncbi:hypothetical protein AZ78_2058 [Lysobacter capsici AZ78]|uniref:Uncharacterized protein n=1 Tax=Lysobacter capsici AZ78 TaxID=1444315 RepID=A0A108U8I5_9GAMM|nr:hypothetical protein [Lysobacter capsici]KWS04509.1 hypothetical protein AZ78_2058 [Lysobacter capsici AZ78]